MSFPSAAMPLCVAIYLLAVCVLFSSAMRLYLSNFQILTSRPIAVPCILTISLSLVHYVCAPGDIESSAPSHLAFLPRNSGILLWATARLTVDDLQWLALRPNPALVTSVRYLATAFKAKAPKHTDRARRCMDIGQTRSGTLGPRKVLIMRHQVRHPFFLTILPLTLPQPNPPDYILQVSGATLHFSPAGSLLSRLVRLITSHPARGYKTMYPTTRAATLIAMSSLPLCSHRIPYTFFRGNYTEMGQ